MKTINLTEEELASLSYDDVAYLILEKKQTKMKIQDLFKEVIKVMNLDERAFEEHLADFFELLSTDKKFIMLEQGFWDLKINHSTKPIIDDDDDEEVLEEVDNADVENEQDETINYDEELVDDDDTEDDLKDLVIIDETEENEIA